MHVAADIILQLSLEQRGSGPPWPHPWDHYPFLCNGEAIWLRYRDLDQGQRELVQTAMDEIHHRLAHAGG
jgi:hypothetical protein